MIKLRNTFVAISFLVLVQLCHSKYRNYDNFDIEQILSDPARAKTFFECVRNEASCSKDDKEMKYDLVEMLTTSCASCTESEKSKLQYIKRRAKEDPKILNLALGNK